MKNLSLTLCLAIATIASPSFSETIDDFVERNGKYYLKFTDEGFSGKVEGKVQEILNDGVWDGKYIEYWDNGQLFQKGNYKDGKKDGLWKYYFSTFGKLTSKGKYKNGQREGVWEGHAFRINSL